MEVKYAVLKELRKKRNLTQDELAKELGVTRASICNYEAGLRTPKYNTLEAYADFFNVSLGTLIDTSTGLSDLDDIEIEIIKNYRGLNLDLKQRLLEYSRRLVDLEKM